MHKNSTIRELDNRYFNEYKDRVHLIELLEYIEFANIRAKMYLLIPDSCRIQKEAPALGKPVMY